FFLYRPDKLLFSGTKSFPVYLLCKQDECVLPIKHLPDRSVSLVQKGFVLFDKPHFSSICTQSSLSVLSIWQIDDNDCKPCQTQSYCEQPSVSIAKSFCRAVWLR